jgi:hypothetical protein
MKTTFEVGINYNDIFRNESFAQLLSNLEKLDIMSEDIFNRINKKVIIEIIRFWRRKQKWKI